MRISDWSSDVCSSDLHRKSNRRPIRRRQRIRRLLARLHAHGPDRRSAHVALVYHLPVAHLITPDEFLRQPTRSNIHARPDRGHRGGARRPSVNDRRTGAGPGRVQLDCRAFGARRDAARTEEHKSELHSLMRTSYAVFWWKKKKHHTRLTISLYR